LLIHFFRHVLAAAPMVLLSSGAKAQDLADDSLRLYAVSIGQQAAQGWSGTGVYLGQG
jgi:hypothetical protein